MKRALNIAILALALTFLSCSKEDDPKINPPVSSIPEISLLRLGPDNIAQFESLNFEIGYIDGDGNIGTADPDVMSLQIIDNRAGIKHEYHIPPQAPTTGIAISGVLTVELKNVILLDQSNDYEIITFDIRLKDGGGNWSNVVTSQEITVTR